MLRFVSAQIPWNAILYLELQRSNKALRDEQALWSSTTLGNICWRESALTVDAINKQLPSQNKVSLALDEWKSTNKQAIPSVIVYSVDRNWEMCEV
jgi:hypothetical protein